VEASRPDADRRIGVIWHTTGSGKSLSMAFLVGVLRRRLANPTFVIEVDRTDLDKQLYGWRGDLHDHREVPPGARRGGGRGGRSQYGFLKGYAR
jgi:type I restriction enzyme R subunit